MATCIHHAFEHQVRRHPDRTAVVSADGEISYTQLNIRANRLAHYLQKIGVAPEVRVGIVFERSLDGLVAILAVLKAGGAYVPLDPAFPKARIDSVLSNACCSVVLAHPGVLDSAREDLTVVLLGQNEQSDIASAPTSNPVSRAAANNLAYVIYTSGSTGRPKGVMIPHAGVLNMVDAQCRLLGVDCNSRVLQFYSFAFDASVFEIFMALLTGATLIVESRDVLMDGHKLGDVIRARRITNVQLPPSVLASLENNGFSDLRNVLIGGEVYPTNVVMRWLNTHSVFNVYGPTECTVWATAGAVKTASDIKIIGKPIPNVSAYVLSDRYEPLPDGEIGELYLGGIGVGRGYQNNPALTADRFVPDPSSTTGGRLYRTGDLAKRLPDGRFEFHGRLDHQIKIRGFRVEPHEVEQVLSRHSAVREVAVVLREDGAGENALAAYVVAQNPTCRPLLRRDLPAHARASLPEYMVPTLFTFLDALPKTANDKIDRNALPAPIDDRNGLGLPPENAVETIISEIWQNVLGTNHIGMEEHFLELGGHSVKAAKIVSRVRDRFTIDLKFSDLFQFPTIRSLSTHVIALILQRIESTVSENGAGRHPNTGDSLEHLLPGDHERLCKLSEHQQQRLLEIVRGTAALVDHKRDYSGPTAPSLMQKRLLFLAQLDGTSPAYNIAFQYWIDGPLDVATLRRALHAVIERHDALRACFEDERMTIVSAEHAGSWQVLDTIPIGLTAQTTLSEEASLLRELIERPFDLSRPPLLRAYLLCESDTRNRLLIVIHHIIFDGWSTDVFTSDLSDFYNGFRHSRAFSLKPLSASYSDYSAWQYASLTDERRARDIAFWRDHLKGASLLTNLPFDRPRPARPTTHGARHSFSLPNNIVDQIRHFARDHGTTPFVVFFAAFFCVLHRYSGDDDLVIGTVFAGRPAARYENVIGFFVNTLPIHVDLSGNPTFQSVVQQLNTHILRAQDHAELPFDQILRNGIDALERSGINTLAVSFVFQNDGFRTLTLDGTTSTIDEIHNGGAKFDVEVQLIEDDAGIRGWFEYASDLFEPATIAQLADHFVTVLCGGIAAPFTNIRALPLVHGSERSRLIEVLNDTSTSFPTTPLVHGLFEAQATAMPDAPAVVFEGRSVTYGDLNRWANQVARRLQRLGVQRDSLVAVVMERSIELVVALLGTLKAGGAYVPIDPDYPADRREFMLIDCEASIVITQPQFRNELSGTAPSVICIDSSFTEFSLEATHNLDITVHPGQLAYMIYTSGSTGQPKGAMNTHAGILNRLLWMQNTFPLDPSDSVLQKTPYSFDVSVWEFFWPLLIGARLIVSRPGGHRDTRYLARLIGSERVTTMHFVPSMLRLFLDEPGVEKYTASLRQVFCSGEELTADLQERFFDRINTALYNLYGPTEAAIDVTYWECKRKDRGPVPIGRPIANIQTYILDEELEPVPLGAVGELYLAGIGIGRGYHRRPSLTAGRFVPNPFSNKPGERMYRTGDLARYRRDGNIVFLGRTDNQIKLNGLRIELGEIECVLRACPYVSDAVVFAVNAARGEHRIEAAVVQSEASAATHESFTAVLRTHLRQRLPDYMVPSAFHYVDKIPLTPNGKVDRTALLTQAVNLHAPAATTPPQTETERQVVSLWTQVLGTTAAKLDDDFFESGGHSFLATKLVMAIRESMQVELPIRALFDARTIRGVARVVDALRAQPTAIYEDSQDLNLESEADLPSDIRVVSAPSTPTGEMRRALLTGSTGFLGAFLLHELLEQTNATIFCVVRCTDRTHGMCRIREALTKYGIQRSDLFERVIAVPGDISQPRLGLPSSQYEQLAQDVDAIYHNAAWVNFIEPYDRLKGPNVVSTAEVLRLATHSRTKPVYYISSSSVYGTIGYFTGKKTLREDDDISLGLGYLFGGYVKSKWVAERMIWNAHRRGVPISVFRCALVLGHSHTGIANTIDFPSRLIKGSIQLGGFYTLKNKFDNFVPVDFASRAIVYLSRQPASNGKAFHVVNPHHIAYGDFWQLVAATGYPLIELDFATWTERLLKHAHRSDQNALFPLLPLFIEKLPPTNLTIVELFQNVPIYSVDNLESGLMGSGISCPRIDEHLVGTWMDFYVRSGFLEAPSMRSSSGRKNHQIELASPPG